MCGHISSSYSWIGSLNNYHEGGRGGRGFMCPPYSPTLHVYNYKEFPHLKGIPFQQLFSFCDEQKMNTIQLGRDIHFHMISLCKYYLTVSGFRYRFSRLSEQTLYKKYQIHINPKAEYSLYQGKLAIKHHGAVRDIMNIYQQTTNNWDSWV